MFETFWNKRRKANPDEHPYHSMCYIVEGSGEDAETMYEIFDEYIPKDLYTKEDREIMVAYLVDIAKDLQ